MIRNFLKGLIFIAILLIKASSVSAEELVAGESATLARDALHNAHIAKVIEQERAELRRRAAISAVLERRNSPLTSSIDAFMNTCKQYELDCYLLPAIAGLESSFGVYTHPASYNPFGWGGGYIMFESWEQSIDAVGKGLRENYINRGAITIEQIGSIYAASPTWASRVRSFISQLEAEEVKIELQLSERRI